MITNIKKIDKEPNKSEKAKLEYMLTPKAAANLAAHIQRRAATYLEVGRTMVEAASTTRSLKPLIGKGAYKRSGTTLIAIGVALIAFPDPTISDVIGAALVALGLLKRKMSRVGVREVYEEIRQTADYIEEVNQHILVNTNLRL
ncbi:MAG: hypothetical protein QXW32_05025 [Nitrososphaerales archaeon]